MGRLPPLACSLTRLPAARISFASATDWQTAMVGSLKSWGSKAHPLNLDCGVQLENVMIHLVETS